MLWFKFIVNCYHCITCLMYSLMSSMQPLPDLLSIASNNHPIFCKNHCHLLFSSTRHQNALVSSNTSRWCSPEWRNPPICKFKWKPDDFLAQVIHHIWILSVIESYDFFGASYAETAGQTWAQVRFTEVGLSWAAESWCEITNSLPTNCKYDWVHG